MYYLTLNYLLPLSSLTNGEKCAKTLKKENNTLHRTLHYLCIILLSCTADCLTFLPIFRLILFGGFLPKLSRHCCEVLQRRRSNARVRKT